MPHMTMRLSLIILALVSGCVTSETRTYREATLPSSPTRWAVGVSPESAKVLTPDEAKAVLIARAYLESDAKEHGRTRPDILEMRANRSGRGWSVRVSFVGFWDNDEPHGGPSYFCTMEINESWEVTSVVGGA